jgi:hypothetical protein
MNQTVHNPPAPVALSAPIVLLPERGRCSDESKGQRRTLRQQSPNPLQLPGSVCNPANTGPDDTHLIIFGNLKERCALISTRAEREQAQ